MSSVDLTAGLQHNKSPWYALPVVRRLHGIEGGVIRLELPNGRTVRLGQGGVEVSLRLRRWSLLRGILTSGDIGFAQGYIDGGWDTADLTALLTLLARNRTALGHLIHGQWLGRLQHRLRHLRNANSLKGSRRNIAFHYDLGNAFYALWLDRTMTYSSARFDGDWSLDLGEAQQRKYQRVLELLDLPSGQSLLEIGCGWGGFAEQAAGSAGHRVRGLTLSRQQLEYASARIDAAGLAGQCGFALQDYRDEQGQYDGIVSIEMFEAVGEAYWNDYFAAVRRALRPGGRAVVQSILIDDALFERYRNGTDFIQQQIFPGGMLPSAERFRAVAAENGLVVIHQEHFGLDYAETLNRWERNFIARQDEVRALGFDARFMRLWYFYLAYCQAGFNSGSTDVAQFVLQPAL
ncbi:MAG TPA: cyclopropane-fatty-acyl-phospholipid synthase family protein [Pseudomonadales bacterium]|jgi:cyclopropane-fatty-acyl-phospholipid synthase|nr:cyclopropane-fatty-acyl-phospholipid synthase family protein [Pseudomonadales bacterium]